MGPICLLSSPGIVNTGDIVRGMVTWGGMVSAQGGMVSLQGGMVSVEGGMVSPLLADHVRYG